MKSKDFIFEYSAVKLTVPNVRNVRCFIFKQWNSRFLVRFLLHFFFFLLLYFVLLLILLNNKNNACKFRKWKEKVIYSYLKKFLLNTSKYNQINNKHVIRILGNLKQKIFSCKCTQLFFTLFRIYFTYVFKLQ